MIECTRAPSLLRSWDGRVATGEPHLVYLSGRLLLLAWAAFEALRHDADRRAQPELRTAGLADLELRSGARNLGVFADRDVADLLPAQKLFVLARAALRGTKQIGRGEFMSDSPVFEFVCEQVQNEAQLSRLEARGTVRLLLKEVGLDPQVVGKGAAILAVDRFLEQALRVRRVADAGPATARILKALRDSGLEDPDGEDPAAIFGRITLRR
jgi:hypothetical protein